MDKDLEMKLDRIENQLAQLVNTISNVNQDVQGIKNDMQSFRAEVMTALANMEEQSSKDIANVELVAHKAAHDIAALKLAK